MKKEQKSKRPKIGLIKSLKVVTPMIVKASPCLFAASCFLLLIQTLLSSFNVYVREYMFNGVTDLVKGNILLKPVLISIIIITAVYVVDRCIEWLLSYIDVKFSQSVNITQQVHRFEKISRLAPIVFENTDNLDDLEKVDNGKNSAKIIVEILKKIVFSFLPYIIALSVYLCKCSWWLVLALFCIFVPTLVQEIVIKKLYAENEDNAAPLRRKQNYYAECITSQTYYKETRLLGGYRYFIDNFRKILQSVIKLDIKTGIKKESVSFVTSVFSVIGRISVYYLMFLLLMKGKISVGEFAAIYSAVYQLESALHDLFYNVFSEMSQNLSYVENYVRFIEFSEDERPSVALKEKFDIELENVKFAYPNQTNNALDGVSFSVKNNETIAIVGENGSGKSTLIKLITGYYKPTYGNVKLDGVDTNDISFSSVAKRLSAVFQCYPNYALTLRECLKIGNIEKEDDEAAMIKACEMAGFSPKNEEWLPKGLDTLLSREFDDGVGLSGGQVQRIAIARAFYRDSSIVVLDEPTAAIDPIEEAKIYRRFAELSKDKTSFIVTHRLASVKIADRIIMMKDGKAIEIGTHEELMKLNGEYRKMYDSQKQWYENNDE